MTKPNDLIEIVTRSFARRAFLQGTAATVLVGCGGDDAASSPAADAGTDAADAGPDAPDADGGVDAGPTTDVPFGVWQEIRATLRTSPDHLAAQAEALVSEGDPEAIYAFVRDRFLTLPDGINGLGGLTKRLWGIRGTLRCGAGTLRDKAELLADLYRRAGFTAEVMEARTPSDPDFVQRVLNRSVTRPFAPQVDDAALAGWREKLGLESAPAPTEVIDADHAQAGALAAQLLALVPDAQTLTGFSPNAPSYMPVVAVQVDGETRYANVADPEGVFGEAGAGGDPRDTDPTADLPDVTIRLSMVTTASPKEPIEIATATFPTEELVGRQVSIAMVPPEDARTLIQMRFQDVRTFIPAISLQGSDMTDEQREANTFASKAVTVTGEVLEVEGETVSYQGQALETGPTDPSLMASVASLDLEVIGGGYPEVRVRAKALDAGGKSVPGLAADAFVLEEESDPQRFQLLENRTAPARVLFVLDESTSLPDAFLGAQAAALLRAVAQDVLAGQPDATFRVFVVGGDPNDGAWTSDPAQVEQAALDQSGFGSNLWGALAAAASLQATTVVMVTDGEATDLPDASVLGKIAQLPPCVFLGVGQTEYPTLEEMAELTGGEVFPVENHDEATDAVLQTVADRLESVYLLRYAAPSTGPDERDVRLAIANGGASGTGTYTVPPPEQRSTLPRIGGLILDIEIDSAGSARQVIAGLPEVPEDAGEAFFDEVHAAMFGSAEVRFEGSPPTLAAALDDLLAARLSLEPLWLAVRGGDPDTIVDTFVAGFERYGATALALNTPPAPVDGKVVFPTGLRAVLTTAQPRFGVGLVHRVSMLPIGPYRAAVEDRREALEASVTATLRHAIVEGALYQRATTTLLAGQPLVALNPFGLIGSAIPSLTPEQGKAWARAMAGYTGGYRIVPASGSPVAFFYVDRATGAVLAVIEDGSGGGTSAEELAALEGQLTSVINWVNAVGGYFGILGLASGVWLSLEKAKLKKLIAATIAIATLDAPVGIEDFSGVAGDVACDTVKGAAGEVLSAIAGNAGSSVLQAAAAVGVGILQSDAFVEAMLGEAPIECS